MSTMSTVPLDTLDHLAALQRPQNSDELRVHLKALYDHSKKKKESLSSLLASVSREAVHALAPSKSGPIADLVVQGIEVSAARFRVKTSFSHRPERRPTRFGPSSAL